MIAIVDYGVGNLRSVQKGFEQMGAQAVIVSGPEELRRAEKIVLPGVGAFGAAMTTLERFKLRPVLLEMIARGTPFLGICLGKQLLMETSDEGGQHRGLGVIPGAVRRFPEPMKVPHMGWNQVNPVRPCPLLKDVPEGAYFYFVHSYFAAPTNKEHVYATTEYAAHFPSVIGLENVYGIQFHPEKSQVHGLQILKNFADL